MINSGEKG